MTFIGYLQNRKIGMPNKLKVLESNKTKRPKQDSQHRLQLPIPKGEEP